MLRGVFISAAIVVAVLVNSTSAYAQSFLNGDWVGAFHEDQPERGPGPELGDYLGIPLNAAGRQYADSWDASRLTLPEHQCRAHVSPYIYRGPIRVRITEEVDPGTQTVIAIKHFLSTYAQERTIWLDGRPHPSEEAPHTWMGFSTGEWQGRVLKVTTTHIKQGWHRRNGIPMSAKATMTEYFIRHNSVLTQVSITEDPVFLSEPLVKTTNLTLDPATTPNQYQAWLFCQADDEVPGRDPAYVPHHLPGKNPYLTEFATLHRLPIEPTRGGSETMYPEYMEKVKAMPIPPRRAGEAVRDAVLKHLLIVAAAVLFAMLSAGVDGSAQGGTAAQPRRETGLYTMPVQGNVHVIIGGGSNVTVQVGNLGAVLVDTGSAQNADAVLASLRQLTPRPVRHIINTHSHPDHVGGNEKVGASGAPISGRGVAVVGAGTAARAEIIAHEETLNRMSAPAGSQAPTPVAAWPTSTFSGKHKEFYLQRRRHPDRPRRRPRTPTATASSSSGART